MFATPGKAGMRQQHDGRFRPTDTGQNKAIDMKTGVGAAGRAKHGVQPAVQQFRQIVG